MTQGFSPNLPGRWLEALASGPLAVESARPTGVFPSTLRYWKLKALLGVLLSMVIIGSSTSLTLAETPATPYTYWFYPPMNATDISWSIHPETDPSLQNWFWAHQWWIHNGDGGLTAGYAGLQTVGSDTGSKIAIFSIWDATGANSTNPNAWCLPFGGEGVGYSCRISFDWQIGHEYTFKVTKIARDAWQATVTDEATAAEHILGTITVPRNWGGLHNQSVSWTEYYGPSLTSCSDYNKAQATFSPPSLADGTILSSETRSGGMNLDCVDASNALFQRNSRHLS